MESNGFIITLWIVWIIAVVAQLVVAVKIFGMASDTKAIKEMMQQFMRMKQAEAGIPAEDFLLPKEEPKKFRWQMWMYIAIAAILLLLFLLN